MSASAIHLSTMQARSADSGMPIQEVMMFLRREDSVNGVFALISVDLKTVLHTPVIMTTHNSSIDGRNSTIRMD